MVMYSLVQFFEGYLALLFGQTLLRSEKAISLMKCCIDVTTDQSHIVRVHSISYLSPTHRCFFIVHVKQHETHQTLEVEIC